MPKSSIGLLRRQHGGRLVEDEDVRAAVERLEDLDPLLLADGDALDALVGIDREVERVREILDALPRGVHVEDHAGGRRLGREHDVLGHRHHRDEHEVLVHHADPVLDRFLRRVDPDRLALDEDLALVGVVEAVEDAHQGRLAGAVLAEQRVHLPCARGRSRCGRSRATPGKCFVIPRSSRTTGRSLIRVRDSMGLAATRTPKHRGRARRPALAVVRVR